MDMPGPRYARTWIWTCHDLDLDMPGPGSGHAMTWTWTCHAWIWTCQDLDLDMPISTRTTWTCHELDLDMPGPGPGPGHAMSWTLTTYIINLHHQLTSFIEYFTQKLSTINPRETTLACGDFNINLLFTQLQ